MLSSVLTLFSGIGTFIIGMKLIASNLDAVAGGRVEELFKKISDSKLAGIGIGVGSAAVLQSSSATTVILVGLVNSGIINLFQATCIIMGANIGTTFTALLISFNSLPIGELFAFLAFLGAIIIIGAKHSKSKTIGYLIGSAGLMFIGLDIIKLSATSLNEYSGFTNLFSSVNSPFIMLGIGLVFTAIIQSSSAITGIVITLAHLGIMPAVGAFYIIMGGNIGSCATAMLASIGGNLNAKRTALINLAFNTIGVIIFLPLTIAFGNKIVNALRGLSISVVIAYFHIAFNLITTVLMIPFIKKLADLSCILIADNAN